MFNDAQGREPRRPQVPDRTLPKITDVQIRYVDYQPPKRRFIQSAYAERNRAIEFVVAYEGDYPRTYAMSPILYVGDTAVGESEELGDDRIRFLAFDEDRLEEGAPIYLGWPNERADSTRQEAQFRYTLK